MGESTKYGKQHKGVNLQNGVGHGPPDVVKIMLNSFRGEAGHRLLHIVGFVVDGHIEAALHVTFSAGGHNNTKMRTSWYKRHQTDTHLILHELALGFRACNADNFGAFDLGKLSNQRADCTGSCGNDDNVASSRDQNLVHAMPRSQADDDGQHAEMLRQIVCGNRVVPA